jgi:hypothetical protein
MESKDISACVINSCQACVQILDVIVQDIRVYLSTYPESLSQGLFSSCTHSQKEIATSHYQYAALLCRHWDRVAEHLTAIGTQMQKFDQIIDPEGVLRCDAILTHGREFRTALEQYLTESERILKSDRPLPRLYQQTQSFLLAAEQFRLYLLKKES